MNPNILFIKTLEDIESRLTKTDPYEILLVAGLLRKLFLDEHPLVDQVNRTHHVKIVFETTEALNKPEAGDVQTFWSVQDGLDPDTAVPGKRRLQLSRDQFFQSVVAVVFGPTYTVRDVILFQANVEGAVHAGAPRTDREKALHSVAQQLSIAGHAPPLRQLLAIARVSLKALAPLRSAVSAA